jgi:hypothetical protein
MALVHFFRLHYTQAVVEFPEVIQDSLNCGVQGQVYFHLASLMMHLELYCCRPH